MVFIKKCIKNILYLVYFLINIFFFHKKKRIIFISYPDASDNSWYLYKYCLKRLSKFELVWLLDSKSNDIINKINFEFARNNNNNTLLILKRWSIKGFFAFCRSKYVFHTHGTYFFIKPAFFAPKIVNLWHGMPIKAIGHLDKKQDKHFCYSDYVICTSKYYQSIMAQVFDISLNNVLITGLPRNDIFHEGLDIENKTIILKKLNISADEKYLVWLPTYRVSNKGDIRKDSTSESFLASFRVGFLEELNEICVANELTIIIKLHPMDALNVEILNLFSSKIKIYNATEWDKLQLSLYDVIAGCNGLISDYSSVIVDCLNTNIPVGVVSDNFNTYNRKILISPMLIKNLTMEISDIHDFVKLLKFENKIENILNNQKFSSEKLLNKIGMV